MQGQYKRRDLHRQGGFTLIELMIVVAIIGILAAIAIPQYQNYVARTQVSRVVSEVSALKTAAEERYARGESTTDAGELGWTQSNLLDKVKNEDGTDVANPAVDIPASKTDGTITATLNGDVTGAIKGTTVTLTRKSSDNGQWTCAFSGDNDYATAACPGNKS
ncbi:pilin [Salinicola sp. RZ23]|uniref:pilin n=1 Tax=Salinicola sp. RZ23 TaxID=1949087 RepID=UPI000DA18ACE|nr:pilin [Salinicola sp. RZ23]